MVEEKMTPVAVKIIKMEVEKMTKVVEEIKWVDKGN